MEPFVAKNTRRNGPERKIQDRIKNRLTLLGWYVMETHGNMYQCGFPDLYAMHNKYGSRWIEVKNPGAYAFTPAQIECFPKMTAFGVGVWILVDDSDHEISKLMKPANWHHYLSILKI